MFKPKNSSNDKQTKSGNNKEESQTIPLKEGWEKIDNNGVQPFFERVEKVDNEEAFETTSIPQQQYIVTYDTIFTMCIQREPYNYSSPLYQKHSEALTRYYKEKFAPALQKAKDQHGLVFLKEWVKRWRCAKWAVDGMTRMFMYLDRFHVPNSEDLLSTGEQGYTLFRKEVFDQFKETARNAILKCIQNEREGEEQDRDLLRDAILVFVELGNKLKKVELQIYKDDFHRVLLIQTREYYKQKSRVWMDQLSCPEYLIQSEKCVLAEQERLASYIDKFSTEGLMLATREELLKVHEEELLQKETGINRMLERTIGADAEVAKEDLSRLYSLYQNVTSGLPSISEAMKNYICEIGNGFIQKSKESKAASGKANKADKGDKDEEDGGGGGDADNNNTKGGGQNDDETKQTGKDDDENKGGGSGGATSDHELIINLINLHERFLSIVRTQFQQDGIFQKALKEAFEDFINREYYTSALLARYANDILRKGTKLAITDLERTMDHVVMIYGYIRDKDIFERDYQTYLASRLLQDLSESEQSERSMIGKLKTEAGYHWTSKLEDMFKDIQRSKELQSEFNKTYGDQFDVELSVSVCTTGAWPTSSIHPIKKPQDIVGVSERFTQYYLNKYSGRRLNFQMDKGKAEVNVLFSPKVKKILVISTYQMIILLLFNNKATLTFGEIVEETGIPREDCMVHLLSMAHPKVKVLRKAPNTKDCNDDHKFQINPKYTNPRAKVNIPVINIQSTTATSQEQESADMEAIVRQRKYQMDAAIVRILKARKTLKHPDLVGEVVKQLRGRFTPKPVDIKKRIANLIELEYLERDEKDRQTYHYKQ